MSLIDTFRVRISAVYPDGRSRAYPTFPIIIQWLSLRVNTLWPHSSFSEYYAFGPAPIVNVHCKVNACCLSMQAQKVIKIIRYSSATPLNFIVLYSLFMVFYTSSTRHFVVSRIEAFEPSTQSGTKTRPSSSQSETSINSTTRWHQHIFLRPSILLFLLARAVLSERKLLIHAQRTEKHSWHRPGRTPSFHEAWNQHLPL